MSWSPCSMIGNHTIHRLSMNSFLVTVIEWSFVEPCNFLESRYVVRLLKDLFEKLGHKVSFIWLVSKESILFRGRQESFLQVLLSTLTSIWSSDYTMVLEQPDLNFTGSAFKKCIKREYYCTKAHVLLIKKNVRLVRVC